MVTKERTRRRPTAGENAKEAGIARALASKRALAWRNAAYHALMQIIREGSQAITSEHITARVGQPPTSSQVGAVMNAFATVGWIERIEYVHALRINQHAASIGLWRPTRAGIEEAGAQDAQGSLW